MHSELTDERGGKHKPLSNLFADTGDKAEYQKECNKKRALNRVATELVASCRPKHKSCTGTYC